MGIQNKHNSYLKWANYLVLSLSAIISSVAQAATTVTFDVSEDSYIRPASKSGDNFDDRGFVEIRDINSSAGSRIAFLKFTVSNLGSATIDTATLKLKLKQVSSEDLLVPTVIDVKLLNGVNRNTWQEADTVENDGSGLTWDNAPDLTNTTLLSSQVVLGSSADSWFEFDLSAAITAEGTYTLLLTTDAATSSIVQFFSKNNLANSADLELTLTGGVVSPGIDVSPAHVITVAPLVGESNKLQQQVTVTNNEGGSLNITSITNASTPGFIISSDSCSSAALPPGASCNFTVEAGNGIDDSSESPQFGFVNIASNSSVTPIFPVFVSQIESDQEQAIRRVPAVVTNISVIDDLTSTAPTGTLEPGKSYTINFSMKGYGEGYQTYAALFACATADNSCAESTSDILVWNKQSEETSISTSDLTYATATSQSYEYSIKLTMPEYVDGGYADTDAIVLRLYQRSQLDIALGNTSISTIVPGGQGLDMIGKLGRKIIIWQQP
ncbi:hypothetical protein RI844_09775 [Thalassotalea fonticola]|uniref:Carbohydrate-binding module family 96 domain-containing protein n=1 Tax=Thalassotalea fonticola TaxID=3065649 RepID=A0ABZ0GUR7_9GAMM|nr:hypothetical protein RI844_09775 [Colwelliaceae bacterium S1-1]